SAVLALTVAGVLIAGNWLLYTVATTTGHTLEASLGYFINPLVAILLGVLVLHEKLRPLQWTAIAVGALAVVIMAVFYGAVPWLSLGLAFTFGFYGLVKSRVGSRYPALITLTGETAMITPLALVAVALLGAQGQSTLTSEG
ncbi:EamA family transporter, partial [Streptomyces sp. tea 10]|nr:EamA family transporter [Streptomyces sp. tea 10]